jgi:hypothetical protein
MPRTSRHAQGGEDDEPTRGRRGARKPAGPPVGLIALFVVLMVSVVVLARMAARNRPEPEEPKAPVSAQAVFGDLPEEAPPAPRTGGGSGGRLYEKAPPGLDRDATWVEAQAVAARAKDALDEAKAAKAAGDHGAWSEKAGRAKALYDEAITMTAAWEEELMEAYGDRDRQVAAIKRERDGWFNLLRTLHKTTGR